MSLPPPPDLYGRPRADRLFRALIPVVAGYERLSRYTRPVDVPVVDRDRLVVVRSRDMVAEDVVSLYLTSGGRLPRWRPGAHLDVTLPSGRRRQYSLCGDPDDLGGYRVAVRLLPDGDGGSLEVHRDVAVGSVLRIRGPRNAFPFVGRGPYLFVAGGIGITPILPMVELAERLGATWRLVYTGRSRATMPFLDRLSGYGSKVDVRTGLHSAESIVAEAPEGASVYCCGPPPMIDAVRAACAGPLHWERFSPPPVVDGEPFEIQVGTGGPVVGVSATESALDALRRVRPDIPYSCRQGFCGTCRVPLLSGRTDSVTTKDTMLTCVDRSSGGRLVVEA